jgi:AcrR family transcriptional regulator
MCDNLVVATRKYEQRQRADSAAQTRRSILEAVATRLRQAPTEPVSLDKVAQLAGVSRSTIYVAFGSRAGLLDAFVEDLGERTGIANLTAAVRAPDALSHMRGAALAASRMLAADIEIYRVLHAMAKIDPDSVGGAIDKMEKGRRGGMAYLAKRLAEEGLLREDMTERRAADLLWVLCSFEAFDLLYTGRKMSVDSAARLLSTTAERALCR